MGKFSFIEEEMSRRRSAHQLRTLRSIRPLQGAMVEVNGRSMINFCSNDYLGIARHPLLQQRAMEFTQRYGTGSTASRLICGSYDCIAKVEDKLAELKGSSSVLILNSGFQANVSIIPVLADANALILSDRLNHNSIIQGIRLARCKKILFDHNSPAHLEEILSQNQGGAHSRILIITESVFSMDGDRCDIDRLIHLAEKYQALLMVDEAHATGVLGLRGMGLAAGKKVDVIIGTFGKALGSFGAYMAGSRQIRDYLINCCAGFIYTTALPPPVIGAIDAALELVPEMEKERKTLQDNASFLRQNLQRLGFDTGNSTTQIIPVITGNEEETLLLSDRLERCGFLATAIRPPTVPQGQCRIRIALSAAHSREQVEQLLHVFGKYRPNRNDKV